MTTAVTVFLKDDENEAVERQARIMRASKSDICHGAIREKLIRNGSIVADQIKENEND